MKILAGGQSLGPMLNLRLAQPDLLVDITRIPELKRVEETDDSLSIGACVTHADIEDGRVPDVTGGALRDVARGIAYRAVRNRGTIGGSLAHADPSADWSRAWRRSAPGDPARPMRASAGADRGLHDRCVRGRPQSGEMRRGGSRAAPVAQGALGLLQVLPQDRRVRPRHRRGAVRSRRSVCRAVFGATESRPIVFADARAAVRRQTGGRSGDFD